MDFALSEEQRMVQQMVREFAQKEIAPLIKESDRSGQMSPVVLPRMAELGILGICLPVRYGGQGMDYISLGLACEELEAVDSTLRVVMSVHMGLNSLGLFQWANEEQKQRFLGPQARGEKIACFGLTEPGAGSDVANIHSTARREGDEYILNGEKMWISLATKAQHCLWIGRTNPKADDPHEALSAFLVELERPGVKTGDLHGKLGMRAGSTGWIAMQDVRVPEDNRIGEEGEGFKIAMACLDNGRYTVAAGATGLIRACLEASTPLRPGAECIWQADREIPVSATEDCYYGRILRGSAAAIPTSRVDEEPGTSQHSGDLAGKMVFHRSILPSSIRGDPGARRIRLQR